MGKVETVCGKGELGVMMIEGEGESETKGKREERCGICFSNFSLAEPLESIDPENEELRVSLTDSQEM